MQHPASPPVAALATETETPGTDACDEALLIEAAQHDPAAIAPLYRRYVTPVFRYLYSRVGNVLDAEDLTSQVFLEALQGLSRYQHRGYFAAWLFTIARRRAANHYRRQPALVDWDDSLMPSSQASAEADPLSQAIHSAALEQLRVLIAKLDERDLELLRLRYSAGLTFAQIAAALGRSQGAVKMAMQRLLARLHTALGGNDEQPTQP
jgi:RNA polymerase sigma-70 factor (ECF subfamily)